MTVPLPNCAESGCAARGRCVYSRQTGEWAAWRKKNVETMKGEPSKNQNDGEELIPEHGGYRKLKSFQIAQLCYDVTVRFCDRYISPKSRTHDQMVQAARSGVQNIAEGSQASGTSKKFEPEADECGARQPRRTAARL